MYLASHLSLAALEILVHANSDSLPMDYIAIAVGIPDDLPREIITSSELPRNWQEVGNERCPALGDAWLDAAKTSVLDVPSAVIPLERNFVINPSHPDFSKIDTGANAYPFHFDPRLIEMLNQADLE